VVLAHPQAKDRVGDGCLDLGDLLGGQMGGGFNKVRLQALKFLPCGFEALPFEHDAEGEDVFENRGPRGEEAGGVRLVRWQQIQQLKQV